MRTLDFDKLKHLAETDPESLEQLRESMINDLIESAPEEYRRRLRGLQFRIDMEREKADTPISSCVAISQMMHDSFDDLRTAIYEAQRTTKDPEGIQLAKEFEKKSADIVPFQR